MADNKIHTRIQMVASSETVRLGESEFRKGAQVIPAPMAADFNPPSASMNPAASTSPSAAGGGSVSAASPNSATPANSSAE